MTRKKLENYVWWEYLDEDLQGLLTQADLLIDEAEEFKDRFHDYSFIVFPAAKAYEGFLKNLFYDMGFITKGEYEGKKLRIGKSLNPTLYEHDMKNSVHYRNLRKKISIYDKLLDYCNGPDLADVLWDTWKDARNILFHWFPNEKNAVDYAEAKRRYKLILDTISLAFKECEVPSESK